MARKTKTIAATNGRRDHELKKMLEDRRRELMHEVQGRIRDARTDSTKEREVLDQGESSEVDIQDEIEFALIQMKAETLNKIDVGTATARRRHLRRLFRVRRRDRRTRACEPFLRGALQGLRRSS